MIQASESIMSIMVQPSLKDLSLDEEQLLDKLSSFFLAGYDTTSISLGNLLYHLGTHPGNSKTKLQKELNGAIVILRKLLKLDPSLS